jgi:putative ABC transport system ATP-binding protein
MIEKLDQTKELALKAKDLNHYYGDASSSIHVLKDICLELKKGEFVALAGPSGCGKSTLLTLAGGLRSVQIGTLEILGYSLNGCSLRTLDILRLKMGMVFQSHHLMEFLTAKQNVQVAMEALIDTSFTTRKLLSLELLKAVGLQGKENSYPSMLSGGQKQRVAFARALAGSPELILADEPTASLDSRTGRQVLDTLRSIAKDNLITVFMATHDPKVMKMADRVVYIDDGRIVSG